MQLNLNLNLKKPDGTDHLEPYHEKGETKHKTIPVKDIVIPFLINATKHEKIANDRAWDFAQQISKNGIIETDVTALDELYEEFDKTSNHPIWIKMNLKMAILEAKKKSSESTPEKSDECKNEYKE